MSQTEFTPSPAQQTLVDAANAFRIDGQLIPKRLSEGVALLDAVDLILQAPEYQNEATYSARKVLRIAQNMIWQVSFFIDGEYDYDGDFHVEKEIPISERIKTAKAKT